MFDQKQIVELKEAFSLIDHDTDGFIDREDLNDMLASLGQSPTEEYIEDMISEAPGSINFTMFLTLMGEKLSGTDPEHEILQAFECFDESGTGLCNAEELREWMTTMGDRFTDDEVSTLLYSLKDMSLLDVFLFQFAFPARCEETPLEKGKRERERERKREQCCDVTFGGDCI
jgi:Ca2+-binding EF-hand superfamily protein